MGLHELSTSARIVLHLVKFNYSFVSIFRDGLVSLTHYSTAGWLCVYCLSDLTLIKQTVTKTHLNRPINKVCEVAPCSFEESLNFLIFTEYICDYISNKVV